MEGLALLGVPHPGDPELLSFYVVERGASSRLVQRLQPGDPLALMGPTGAHTSRKSGAVNDTGDRRYYFTGVFVVDGGKISWRRSSDLVSGLF